MADVGRTDLVLTALIVVGLVLVVVASARPRATLYLTAETDQTTYAPGADVELRIRLEVRGTMPVLIEFGTRCTLSFVITDLSNTPIYDHTSGRLCPFARTHVVLNPGESMVQTFVWHQIDDSSTAVPAGTYYRIVGRLLADPPVPLRSASVDVFIG